MNIITFLSDFGRDDWFAAAVKGEIFKKNPTARVVDITHALAPQDIRGAAFVLHSVYKNFPGGTVHLAVVDPGVGSARTPLIVTSESYIFVGPDNGIFSYIYNKRSKVYAIKVREQPSTTFHARDVFAPVAGLLASGKRPSSLGRRIESYCSFPFPRPRRRGRILYGEILYVDRFGNMITNIPTSHNIDSLFIRRKRVSRVGSYHEGKPDSLICVQGSTGFYEIAVNKGNACKITRARAGSMVMARFPS